MSNNPTLTGETLNQRAPSDVIRTSGWLVFYLGIMGAFALLSGLNEGSEHFGFLSVLPAILTLSVAVFTRRSLESIFAGIIAGLLLISPSEVVTGLGDLSMNVVMNETIAWIVLVCGMMGGLINILERGGSVISFGNLLARGSKPNVAPC